MKKNYFIWKHRSGQSNRVVDALSRRRSLFIEMRVEVLGFDDLNNLYEIDPNPIEPWKACKNLVNDEKDKWVDYFILEDILF